MEPLTVLEFQALEYQLEAKALSGVLRGIFWGVGC